MVRIINILFGCLLTSVGVVILNHAEIVTGGTAGLSLNVSYLTSLQFALVFFLINIPFYVFSVLRMGWHFTLSTIFAVTVLSVMTGGSAFILPDFSIEPFVGAVVGGMSIGLGISILFINGASLGGANILALFLHKKFNWNPGKVNFLFDFFVVLTGMYAIGLVSGFASVLSIIVTSCIISYFKTKIAEKNEAEEKAKSFGDKSKELSYNN
ncbi:YitT family protein [Bacillus sp. FJAT-44742]|uniref:YitT family protein n=1 Tax=Bacillus sp. FJAT-44742 TaxID=2014005 RepID=UPI000C24A2C1|nr:YitT family protein [Bacillus sp. FJAT-44742]